jgi:hypothetical protein
MKCPDDSARIISPSSIQQAFADEYVDFRFAQLDHDASPLRRGSRYSRILSAAGLCRMCGGCSFI